ncbi:hypothetical protein [Streptomyces xiamenensis]|uniref:hypothetical protein n=1 Tax=Streptomyces xiamenensis TaxID=408015 RepID=UPI0035DAD378
MNLTQIYDQLPSPAKHAYRCLAAHPAAPIAVPVAEAALTDLPNTIDSLTLLCEQRLLEPASITEQPAYRMPPQARDHAIRTARSTGPAEARQSAYERMCNSYVITAHRAQQHLERFGPGWPPAPALTVPHVELLDLSTALRWFREHQPALLAIVMDDRTQYDVVWRLVVNLSSYWHRAGHPEQAGRAWERAEEAARNPNADSSAWPAVLTSAGLVAVAPPTLAERQLTYALDQWTANPDDHRRPWNAARAQYALGHVLAQAGRPERAADRWLRAVADCHRANDPRTAGWALIALARYANEAGELDAAGAYASSAERYLDDNDLHGAAVAQVQLAAAHQHHDAEASFLLESAIRTLERLGAIEDQITAHNILAQFHRRLGRTDREQDALRRVTRLNQQAEDAQLAIDETVAQRHTQQLASH